jgi:hypothetical protein
MSFVTSGVVPVWLILWYNLRTQFLLSRVTFSRREIYECQNFRCWALCARSTGTEARQSTQKLSFSGLLESFFKHDPLIVENGNIPFENSYIRRLSDYKVWVPCEEWPRVYGSTYVKPSSFQDVKLQQKGHKKPYSTTPIAFSKSLVIALRKTGTALLTFHFEQSKWINAQVNRTQQNCEHQYNNGEPQD